MSRIDFFESTVTSLQGKVEKEEVTVIEGVEKTGERQREPEGVIEGRV